MDAIVNQAASFNFSHCAVGHGVPDEGLVDPVALRAQAYGAWSRLPPERLVATLPKAGAAGFGNPPRFVRDLIKGDHQDDRVFAWRSFSVTVPCGPGSAGVF
jgi:hypothetical protein